MGRLGFAVLFTAFLSGCLPEGEQPKVLISVQKTIEVPADGFSISAYPIGRGDTQAEALEAVKNELDAARSAANAFAGVETLSIEASDIEVLALPDPDCSYEGYRSEERCPTNGYVARITLKLNGTPALEAGNLVSLLTEEVSGRVSLNGFAVIDRAAAKTQATAEAIAEARASAEQIADASGLSVGALLEVRPKNAPKYFSPEGQYDRITVSAGRAPRRPATTLTIDQPMGEVSVDYLLTFALEPAAVTEN
jgi:uncharacterized protein YggE